MKDGTTKANNNQEKLAEEAITEAMEQELRPLFDSLLNGQKDSINLQQILDSLQEAGISSDDLRVKENLGSFINKDAKEGAEELSFQDFCRLSEGQAKGLIKKAILKQFAVPDFKAFCRDIEKYYQHTKGIREGEAKNEEDAELYAVSVCTVDGQQFQLGDHEAKFALQSVSKAINYPIALHERGEDKVHQHVGREPSGRGYNGLVLNQDRLPHNPMINAGAIMVCSLIKPEEPVDQRLRHVEKIWGRLCANTSINFNEQVYHAEPVDRNMALSYFMKDQGAFPEGADIYKTMELYNKCCAIEITVDQLAMAAASLANGGICPVTNDTIFSPDNVRDCLSLMLSCGMYDYSGEFAFLVGLPAKSGVSGAMMVVVPGLMGLAIYSPPLDELGNPVRGIKFCNELVKDYSLHKFDQVTYPDNNKKDPRRPGL